MYGIYANIWDILMVNVTIYSIHGSYGIRSSSFQLRLTRARTRPYGEDLVPRERTNHLPGFRSVEGLGPWGRWVFGRERLEEITNENHGNHHRNHHGKSWEDTKNGCLFFGY